MSFGRKNHIPDQRKDTSCKYLRINLRGQGWQVKKIGLPFYQEALRNVDSRFIE